MTQLTADLRTRSICDWCFWSHYVSSIILLCLLFPLFSSGLVGWGREEPPTSFPCIVFCM